MPDVLVILVDLAVVGFLVLIAAGWNRLRFVRGGSSFRCRLGRVTVRGKSYRAQHWARFKTRAKWADDVLVAQIGPLWALTLCVPVRLPLDARIQAEERATVRRLGAHPHSLIIERDGRPPLLVAVRAKDRTRLVGPFLAAAVAGLPSAPRSVRRRKT